MFSHDFCITNIKKKWEGANSLLPFISRLVIIS